MFNFSDNLSALRWTSIGEALGQVDTFVRSLGQTDISSDDPQQRHLVAKCVITLVRLTSGQVYPPGWGFRSSWHLVRLHIRLTFGQMYPHAETSCSQVCYYFSQTDLWSDIPPRMRPGQVDISSDSGLGWPLVILLTECFSHRISYFWW